MNNLKAIGLVIAITRESKEISMRKLAVNANLSVSTISMIERGARDFTVNTLLAISKALNTYPQDIFILAEKIIKEKPELLKATKRLSVDKNNIVKFSKKIKREVSDLLL